MKKIISPFSLLLASVNAMVGAGWLFSCFYAAQYAGGSSIIAWIIGAIIMCLIAFVFIEITTMFPVVGSTVRVTQFSHGTLASFIFAWIIAVSYIACVNIEIQTVVQYLSYFFPNLTVAGGKFTVDGFLFALVVMLIISIINVYSLRWLMRVNNILTIIKILAPIFIAMIILFFCFSPKMIINPGGTPFMVDGYRGIFTSISAAGIVMCFNGFKQVAELSGEVKNPKFSIPFAFIGSIVIVLVLMLLIQVAFLSSLTPDNLRFGMSNLTLLKNEAPLVSTAIQNNIDWLVPIIYLAVVISIFAAGFIYCSFAARALYGMSVNGYVPKFLAILNSSNNPIWAILVVFLGTLLFFVIFPGWQKVATFITILVTLSYVIGPINLVALRHQLPDYKRSFRLPYVYLWAYLAFYFANLLAYWCGWDIISRLGIILSIGLLIFFVYRKFGNNREDMNLNYYASLWIYPYFGGLTLISYLGSISGGIGLITFGWDFLIIALFSILIFILALKFKLSAKESEYYVNKLLLKD